ncbi:MAG TPA: nuclear transport factor 2 family protein [Chitinophagaceae bacterium]|nr:nuclear transport factor 2 family protein [Chitinophagaceae bacterium]
MTNNLTNTKENEIQIRQLVENWAQAVRNKDIETILAHHSADIVMYDVPKPFKSVGLDAYRKTWDTFFAFTKLGVFDIQQLHVIADENVAFCFAEMKCADKSNSAEFIELDFRLTIGLKKINNEWTIVHEHHSVPSE